MLLLVITFIASLPGSFSYAQETLDSFIVKYSGSALVCDSMLIYSKPDKFKIVECLNEDYAYREKITFLIGQELIIITEDERSKTATSITLEQPHNEIKNGIEFLNINNYKEYSELVGSENVIGYLCNIHQSPDGNKIWVYNDTYVLKAVDVLQNRETVAFEFIPNASIGDKIFEVPSDTEIRYIRGK